jgi:hypothetical protein
MQNIFKNPKKITRGTRHDNKDNRSGFWHFIIFQTKVIHFTSLQAAKPKMH